MIPKDPLVRAIAHFYKTEIIGETKQSWHTGVAWNPTKHPKKNNEFGKRLYTEEQVENECWKNSHAFKLSEAVRTAPIEQLKQIAKIIGYNHD